ncbi:MAG: TrkH family potassium uptake protein [Bacteroidales bacterium]|nr:TrkH family potassium uptake protein [Bacteroidales bacterium]MDT8430106.1 TrkH family potassium uptake protein [Bacteroidales bacterium]
MRGIINFRIVFRILTRILMIISFALIISAMVALIYDEPLLPFIWSVLISFSVAAIIHFFGGNKNQDEHEVVGKREAYLAVTLSWTAIGLIGSMPYLFSHSIPSFYDAMFESVSGFTTTGSSILNDIESLPKTILFWRSLTHWIGGIGIIVLFIIVMPALQIGGYNLFTLESSLQEKIKPKIKSVGYRLLLIYLILTFAEIGLLLLGKMNLYESVCHAFGTIATGGFSPKNTSIAGYSPYIQYIVMAFMLLSGTNFVIHYYLFKRQFMKVRNNDEIKFYFGVIGIIGAIITIAIVVMMNKPVEESIREAFFQTISIVTCTGYATADYMQWPIFAWVILFFAMFLGGSTGSTAGGIKMARHVVLIRNVRRFFRNIISPNAIIPVRLNKNVVDDETNHSILSFVMVYLMVFVVGTVLMFVIGVDGMTATSSVATCMAGIGPGLGSVGPVGNFSHLPDIAKVLLTMVMLIGRLEIYTVILIFTPSFWRH